MAEVKWIKLTTDMFENRKIRHLRKLPDGNNIVLIWVMLLTLAGKCNAGGMIFLTENIPYTTKMLADELDFEENTVILALDALENLGMIRRDGFLSISGWDEHQNSDGLDRIREQTRQRVAKYRERQKELPANTEDVALRNATDRYDVTQSNAPRIRIRIEEDIEEEKDIEREEDTPLKGGVGGKEKKTVYTKAEFEEDLSVLSKRMAEVVVDWMRYKKSRGQSYKRLGAKSLITQIKKYADQFGDEAVIQVIENCKANQYQGITFDAIAKMASKKHQGRVESYDYGADTEDTI